MTDAEQLAALDLKRRLLDVQDARLKLAEARITLARAVKAYHAARRARAERPSMFHIPQI